MPARLDFCQSATGLLLGLFMWVHLFLVASILLGQSSFDFVAKVMEGAFLTSSGEGYPILVSFAAMSVFTLFIIHSALGIRKFPSNWQQHNILCTHLETIRHKDTNLWFIQFITGFIMFFLGSVHLFIIMTHPAQINSVDSSHRIISEWMWPLYFVLLISVELHGTIGLYRLCVKWGWFEGKDAKTSRKKLKTIKSILSFLFIVIGIAALITFSYHGIKQLNDNNSKTESKVSNQNSNTLKDR